MDRLPLRKREPRKSFEIDALVLKILGWNFVVAGALAATLFPADDMNGIKAGLLLISYLGLPIFCLLLVEGFLNTSNCLRYGLLLFAAAVVAEPFYDFAVAGTWFDFYGREGAQNTLFALPLCLVILHFLNRFGLQKLGGVLGSLLVLGAGFLWTTFLNINYGGYMILVCVVLFWMRNQPFVKHLLVCVISFPMYISPPLAVLLMRKYQGSRKQYNKYIFYALYPALWIVMILLKLLVAHLNG